MGTDQLYYKMRSTNPDIIFTKGKHLQSLKIVPTIENVKNAAYLTGGTPSGGTNNIFRFYSDATSVGKYGQRLQVLTDNHVLDAGTALAVVQSFVDENKDEQHATTVTVLDKTMDISLLRVGMMVGFRGYGNFEDSLKLQITRVDYFRDYAVLTLGRPQRRQSIQLEQINRNLVALQTIDNPNVAS
jgi:hypothetical protein